MDHVKDNHPRAPGFGLHVPLGILMAVVCIAGIAAAVGWMALAIDKPNLSSHGLRAGLLPVCNICGVVEQVRVVETRRPTGAPPSTEGLLGRTAGLQLNGDRGEGVVMLLAALGGTVMRGGGEQPPLYETAVLLDDGSVRVMREYGTPPWKQGDRVKVMRGRIERLS